MRVRNIVPALAAAALVVTACGAPGDSPGGADDPGGRDDVVGRENDEETEDTEPAPGTTTQPGTGSAEVVAVMDTDGREIGHVIFDEADEGVSVTVEFSGLEPGFMAMHIHENAVCDPQHADGPFQSTGGHYNPAGDEHPGHAGDLPPLLVTGEGTVHAMVVTDRFELQDVLDEGTAVILHQGRDNQANIPERYGEPDQDTLDTGDAGDRVACGVIEPDQE
ncbi:superoxide dismutase family protein [Phytoactinopolyspora alkaliphila]|uniref:Superoxide dismutase [Cu-Zn] n=1 Tax=Phytoactinopolyspora alkaliphila TaxID=1783498 RepID=A0A6N9YPD2_9ACTN|nr:superoxide dismutase family protein [Phytoactinopolyspora alkaliphila]NED96921.1 superoxide dismutase family protein [Phytoactinopolyspora alkaliphila]